MDRYRKRRFAKNLDALLTARCVTRKEAAAGALVPYQWLRRAVSEGISRPDKRSRGHLGALARYLGLASEDQLWDRDLYVPPPPSSIKHEADRLGELMREYVLVAGTEDELLREIVKRIDPVVREQREREKTLEAERVLERSLEESRSNLADSIERTAGREAVARWREQQATAKLAEEERQKEMQERAKGFREAGERIRTVAQTLTLFRWEVIEKLQSFGLPRIEEVDLPTAEIIPFAEQRALKTIRDLAPHVSDLWLAKYAQLLGKSPAQTRDQINKFVLSTYGIVWEGTAETTAGPTHCEPSGGREETESAEESAASEPLTAETGVDAGEHPWWRNNYLPPETYSVKDEAAGLGEVESTSLQDKSRTGVDSSPSPLQSPEALEWAMSPAQEVASRKGKLAGRELADGPEASPERPASPEPGRLYLEVARLALDRLDARQLRAWKAAGLPGVEEIVLIPEEVAAYAERLQLNSPVGLARFVLDYVWMPRYSRLVEKMSGETKRSAPDFIADHDARKADQFRRRGQEKTPEEDRPEPIPTEEEVLARAASKRMVQQALGRLSPEQSDYFSQGFKSGALAERHLESELFLRISGRMADGPESHPRQSPDEAVEAIVAGLVEDYDKSMHARDAGDSDFRPYEPIVLEEKSLESRHGEPTPDDDIDHRAASLPVGSALQAELANSHAEDKATEERQVDDLLAPLGELPLPDGGGTYLGSIKRLGNPKSVATAAIRACRGDMGKALKWLIDKVDKSIKAEKSPTVEVKRPEPPRVGGETPPRVERAEGRRPSVKVRTEDIRECVLQSHRLGMAVEEIIVDLRNDEDVPEGVRRAKKAVLYRKIVDIIARSESDKEDELAPDEFDASRQDDMRRWEVDDDRDPPR